jgi:hypothetical protein
MKDRPQVFSAAANDLETCFAKMQASLPPDHDIAFSSVVHTHNPSKRRYHLPLIDFHGDISDIFLNRVADFVQESDAESIAFYKSGKSLHAYVGALLSQQEWVRFMGGLLLMNRKEEQAVDTRWVGHRLRAGYAGLRWTANQGQYTQLPAHLRTIRF